MKSLEIQNTYRYKQLLQNKFKKKEIKIKIKFNEVVTARRTKIKRINNTYVVLEYFIKERYSWKWITKWNEYTSITTSI